MKVIVVDNYDSFTYNLVQYLGELGCHLEVFRNDQITPDGILDREPARIVISPGPGTPDDAGISLDVIRELADRVPILGVCLGHQVIGQAFGGTVIAAPELRHGKTSRILHNGGDLFGEIPSPFEATRYHSLVVEQESLPSCLAVTARTSDGTIMGLQHESLPVHGVQFHPESILTPTGKMLLKNFLCLKN